jgi:hypothetical protein
MGRLPKKAIEGTLMYDGDRRAWAFCRDAPDVILVTGDADFAYLAIVAATTGSAWK